MKSYSAAEELFMKSSLTDVLGSLRILISKLINCPFPFYGGCSGSENGSEYQRILLLRRIEYQHIVCLDSYIEADIFEMFVIDGQINLCRVAEFVMHRYVASDDRPRCQMDGVGESVVGVQIFDTQPTIENKGVPLYIQRLERPVQMDISRSPVLACS